MNPEDKGIDAGTFRMIKHDIKNQLSNINLLLDQLKHEMQNAPADQLDYMEMLTLSIAKIDTILKSTD
jgi:two-component sensor histidine kinase